MADIKELWQAKSATGTTIDATALGVQEEGGALAAVKKELTIRAQYASRFSEEAAKAAVVEIMENEDNPAKVRIWAAQEIFKVMGTYAPERKATMTATVPLEVLTKAKGRAEEIRAKYEAELQAEFMKGKGGKEVGGNG